jgi:tetratricopeptide (TPR) repeat protein
MITLGFASCLWLASWVAERPGDLRIDAGFQCGSADRALGRWYLKVPGWLGGSQKKSVEHLERSLAYDPGSAASHFFLAETFLQMDRREEAKRELQRVLAAPLDAEWAPETREFQKRARQLLDAWRQGDVK